MTSAVTIKPLTPAPPGVPLNEHMYAFGENQEIIITVSGTILEPDIKDRDLSRV